LLRQNSSFTGFNGVNKVHKALNFAGKTFLILAQKKRKGKSRTNIALACQFSALRLCKVNAGQARAHLAIIVDACIIVIFVVLFFTIKNNAI
jgi:hypothetical protein